MGLKSLSLASLLILNFTACSSSGSGSGSPEDYDLGEESNIPLADKDGALADINYGYDSTVISDSAKQILKNNAQWITQNKSVNVVVEGHCDQRGTKEYNLALGERRAKSAMDYLRSLGVASSRLSEVSYGSEIPLDPSSNEAAYAKNRRAHFSVKK